MPPMPPPKNFGRGKPAGIEKVIRDPDCRVCGGDRVQAAHLWHRSVGEKGFGNPDLIVPLCQACHEDFDHGNLDLLPYVSYAEQAAVVSIAGIERARKRLTGGKV